ncbi:MAG: hypothetical protein QW491_14895 [Thermoproteota archaeon]
MGWEAGAGLARWGRNVGVEAVQLTSQVEGVGRWSPRKRGLGFLAGQCSGKPAPLFWSTVSHVLLLNGGRLV